MEAGVSHRPLLLILGLVLLIRLPFLNQAIQGDDTVQLAEASHALVDPLHPEDTMYVFRGDNVDLRGLSHPPMNGWILAGLLAVCGEVKEIPFHAAYILFSLIAAWATWSLANRLVGRDAAFWATLLFVAVPVFVVNGNSLETDIPFLAFWMAATALFVGNRLALAALALLLAALTAYQAILLTPILGVYCWLFHRRSRRRWLTILVPGLSLAAWQLVERLTTGVWPAAVLAGYFRSYGFQAPSAKLVNGLALLVHSWFLIFPVLVPAAFILAWRRRREPETRFLLGWLALFFGGALAVFFAGAARYALPMAAPLAMLASRLRPRWLAAGFAFQMALGVGLAVVNYQHWGAYRAYAASLRPALQNHRVWVDDEWGLRHYLQDQGALPLRKTERLRGGDIVVSSQLSHSVNVTGRLAPVAPPLEIRSAIPLRIIGLETHSGYSVAALDRLWPFGFSAGVIDRVSAVRVVERHPTLQYLSMAAPEAVDQIVSGIYGLENHSFRWMSRRAVVVLKSPGSAAPLRVEFQIHALSPARRVTLRLDGRDVASGTYAGPGNYSLESAPVLPAGAEALLEIGIDRTFTAPPDIRELGLILTAMGFPLRGWPSQK